VLGGRRFIGTNLCRGGLVATAHRVAGHLVRVVSLFTRGQLGKAVEWYSQGDFTGRCGGSQPRSTNFRCRFSSCLTAQNALSGQSRDMAGDSAKRERARFAGLFEVCRQASRRGGFTLVRSVKNDLRGAAPQQIPTPGQRRKN